MRISDWSSDVCSSDLPGEVLGHGVNTFDDFVLDIALVGHAHFLEAIARDHAVGADETQHSGEHLISARAVMRIDDDDFGGFGLADSLVDRKSTRLNSSH